MNMEKLMEEILNVYIQRLNEHKIVMNLAYFFRKDKFFINELDSIDRRFTLLFPRMFCEEKRIEKIITVGEAHLTSDLNGFLPRIPADHEDSIMVIGEDISGDICCVVQIFSRDKKGIIKLKEKYTFRGFSPMGTFLDYKNDR